MAIAFTCPHCGYQTSASEAYAGSSGPCASCGAIVKLPGVKAELASPGKIPAAKDLEGSRGKEPTFATWAMVVVIAMVCCGGLVALLLPTIEPTRTPARRSACTNHLKQIGLALQSYHDQNGAFPPAYITDENGRPMHSWRVLILPYLEEQQLYNAYHFDEPWDGPNNRQLLTECPNAFRCPSDFGDKNAASYHVVVGPGAGWKANEGTRLEEITDGTPQTIAVIEGRRPGIHWLDPTPMRLDEFLAAAERTAGEDGHPDLLHPGGRMAVFFDGYVRFLNNGLDPKVLRHMFQIDDGNDVSWAY
ncbi:DUF1559 family PulG-like putative transporter [Lignipirellula cremea]|uniref:DUF1559 domain-containing protein n=1 Tax=Lignipirellula cremea TaxID=2528010 RepID=A0A518DU26_9BACT|nr:DUF1559 domain-containing protein [Lignipirellula cremea]QDU95334.1 hypothetical protein Pla8534_31490 [Lignipirellula cremea]